MLECMAGVRPPLLGVVSLVWLFATARAQLAQPNITLSSIRHLFAFGDSYTMTGYNPSLGINNIPYIGNTTSNGLTWSQYLGLNNPGTTTPYPSFYSFAQGGAVVNRTIGGSGGLFNESNPVDFVAQYLLWDEAFAPPPPSVPWTGEDSLFAIWFGINDVGISFLQNGSFVAQAPEIAETYNDVIGALYASEMVAANVDRWNFALSTYVHDVLTQTFPEAKYVLFDTVPFFNALLDDGFNYGFTETAGACPDYIPQRNNPLVNLPSCPWPFAQYFWADDYHPTWRVHQYLAQALAFFLSPEGAAPAITAGGNGPLGAISTNMPSATSAATTVSSATTTTAVPTDLSSAAGVIRGDGGGGGGTGGTQAQAPVATASAARPDAASSGRRGCGRGSSVALSLILGTAMLVGIL